MAVKAFVLLTVDTAKTRDVMAALRQNPKLKEVHEVLGPYDIVVVIEAQELDRVTSILRQEIRPIPGVRNTLTCMVMG
ncbi:MAG: Lrp/AsnC ligand binding domain-containing protein [Chloroflexi bacterium]|nr:Lrp/AsnC ligand binding domain-containing protein [Chloroflexota bacterium]